MQLIGAAEVADRLRVVEDMHEEMSDKLCGDQAEGLASGDDLRPTAVHPLVQALGKKDLWLVGGEPQPLDEGQSLAEIFRVNPSPYTESMNAGLTPTV